MFSREADHAIPFARWLLKDDYPEERDKLFARMASTWSNFAAYQARATDRTIPVMVLSRIEA